MVAALMPATMERFTIRAALVASLLATTAEPFGSTLA